MYLTQLSEILYTEKSASLRERQLSQYSSTSDLVPWHRLSDLTAHTDKIALLPL